MTLSDEKPKSNTRGKIARGTPPPGSDILIVRSDGPATPRQGSGFRVQGSGCRVQGSEFRDQGSGFRVQGSDSGFKEWVKWSGRAPG